jgi:2-phospho-L-lactate transferase/gluconeogenesis factor (CofD/UPF0052 family)
MTCDNRAVPGRPVGPVRVVLFSGGRGSGALTRQLVSRPGVSLTIAVNGYDDGGSTGEVRRFLGNSLGPSDFRKNAARVARELGACSASLVDLLDSRFPDPIGAEEALARLMAIAVEHDVLAGSIDAFVAEYRRRPAFAFGDCSVGNLVFAGAFLASGRDFNRAVDDYCSLLGLHPGLIENVTDGTNAHLVALDTSGKLLRTEEAIVDARRRNSIRKIFLLDHVPSETEASRIERLGEEGATAELNAMEPRIAVNPRLAEAVRDADIIIYAPGTQHSSLFPSYMTPGLAQRIADNLGAIKLLITNIEQDAEIAGSTAVDLIDRALYYLRLRSGVAHASPCLITHYLMNEPGRREDAPYVQLGAVELLEDPRLVRIGAFEDGITGQHDAARVLEPFLDAMVSAGARPRVAVLLHEAGSLDKVTETLLEMVRGGIADERFDAEVFCLGEFSFVPAFLQRLPFAVHTVPDAETFAARVHDGGFDYVALFESSGMYRGEDLVALASHLTVGHLDAVWGSRRLSVRDIHESYRVRYQGNPLLGAVSFVGSHVLSLACLLLYGRYISDTLSAVRAMRASDAVALPVELTHRRANQYILSRLLRRRAEILELPVRFTPISPARVHRTNLLEGLQALMTLILLSM